MSSTPSLEDLFTNTFPDQKTFAQDCAEAFASEAGSRVLAMLCTVIHPLRHTPGMTDHEHGRAEVVSLLWRHAAKDNATLT